MSARGAGLLYAGVTLAGAATMVVELSAVRLVAPWFGSSSGVWTNVIGVILLALSVGYLAGARLAARARPERALALVMLLSAAFTGVLPLLAHPVCALFMPAGLGLDQAAGLFLWGSLAATLVLFLAPAVCLGCIGPLAVEVLARDGASHAGTAGGRILCASTLGSLAGCFATTHLLLPGLGVTRTLLGAAAALATAGALLGLRAGLDRRVAAVCVASVGAALLGSRLELPALPEGVRLLERAESPYQSLRAVEDGRVDPPMRLLQVNEGLDSFQSVWAPHTGLLGPGYYYDFFALPAWWSRAEGPWRCAVLGLGAGTALRVLDGASPPSVALSGYGIEIDARAVELGRRWFDLSEEGGRWHILAGLDARAGLRCIPGELDLVVLDAYAHQVEIPAHLSTLEFLREVRVHLAPGGWLAVNVGGFGFDDPVVEAMSRTVAAAFEQPALVLRVPLSRNFVVFARRDAAPAVPGDPTFAVGGPVGDALLPPLELDGGWKLVLPGDGPVLTDDLNPVDQLQRRSLEQAHAHRGDQS